MKTTKKQFKPEDEEYWINRQLDDARRDWNTASANWLEDYVGSRDHPHRKLVIDAVGSVQPFESLLEVGCNVGTNISLLRDKFSYGVPSPLKDDRIAGIDVSVDAVIKAREILPGVDFRVGTASELPFSDKSFDVVLLDAVLIYVGPKEIKKIISEIDRVAKKAVILVEWFDSKSTEGVIKDFHWARNYPAIFKKLGFKVETVKITEATWPKSKAWATHGNVFTFLRQSKTGKKS